MTPYLMVDATAPLVQVPTQYVDNGKIVLNIEPQAIANLNMGNKAIEFNARFSGVSHLIHVPIKAVKAIYAFENGRGMVFNEDEEDGDEGGDDDTSPDSPTRMTSKQQGKPSLKIVK
jgi:stringent starvation protein B